MAIKIDGTIVINNGIYTGGALQNILDIAGVYDHFRPAASANAGVIDMNYPFYYDVLTTNTTYTVTNVVPGRTTILDLDTSATPRTPSWPTGVFNFAPTEPTWSDHRYWLVNMAAYGGTDVRVTAIGYDA